MNFLDRWLAGCFIGYIFMRTLAISQGEEVSAAICLVTAFVVGTGWVLMGTLSDWIVSE